jgi:hypothetical protein
MPQFLLTWLVAAVSLVITAKVVPGWGGKRLKSPSNLRIYSLSSDGGQLKIHSFDSPQIWGVGGQRQGNAIGRGGRGI